MSEGRVDVSNRSEWNLADTFLEDSASEQSDLLCMLYDEGNLRNIVRASSKKLLCFCAQHVDELESKAMFQCAMYTLCLPPFQSQATTTSTGSCFIILCNTCAEQCSRFLCVHGRGGYSTSSIELDISYQGNSIVGGSFLKNLGSGLSRVHSCAVPSCYSDRNSHYFCEINNVEREKCLRIPLKTVRGANVSGNFFKKCKESDDSSEESGSSNNDLVSENVCNDSIKKCFFVKKGKNKCAAIGLQNGYSDGLKYFGLHQLKNLHSKNQVKLKNDVPIFSGYYFVKKPAEKLTADCGEENQCELGGVFEASHRLKRLEEHFKGLSNTKKLFKDVLGVVDVKKNCINQTVTLEDLNKTCLQKIGKWIPPPIVSKCKVSALSFDVNFSTFQENTTQRISPNVTVNAKTFTIENNYLKVSHETSPNVCAVKKGDSDFPSVEFGDSDAFDENKNSHCQRDERECSADPIDSVDEYVLDENCLLNFLPDLLSSTSLYTSKSVFDVRFLGTLDVTDHALECYYEFDSSSCEEDCEHSDLLNEAVPSHSQKSFESAMRELNGPLRGLLKKPNRPPPARKNRVVFDETRNEFFEADYIILIREDCAYDEEDEEPCTCGEHELIRLCCEEGCQCNYNEENKTPQSPKYAPPLEFVDDAALSPPDGYKDNGLKNAIGGALSGHVFGAQHIQQLQVIQRLQQQRAAMLAARATTQQPQGQQTSPATEEDEPSTVCTECAECVECAANQIQASAHVDEELSQLSVPAVAIIPLHNNSPERRVTQKEIIAGEERPKYLLPNQHKTSQEEDTEKIVSVHKNQRYVVETITMTTVTERRIVREATEDITTVTSTSGGVGEPLDQNNDIKQMQRRADSIPAQISGILKGGKLWKHEQCQVEDSNNTSSEEDSNLKRSVRFMPEANKEISREGDGKAETEISETENPTNELIPFKKHSSLFNNALRPNSAMRQLFPSSTHPPPPAAVLTHETLRAFEESKRGNPLMSSLLTSSSESDTMRRTIERNSLRRSLIKKKTKSDISLEERIKQLTCDIEESTEDISLDNGEENEKATDVPDIDRRDSPTGEESPSQAKYIPDKSFSPSSSASSSSSGSTSAYKKISNVFNREKRQDKIPEIDENPIIIIPQECRCPAAPDLGMGVQVPAAHTQIHQTPPRQTEPRKQFLSTLAPLTACVAGQKDDFSYYTLATAERNTNASTQCSEYNIGDLESPLLNNDGRKVAPDVIAGTPGQEQDELAAFVNQEANRTEKIKKRYSNESSLVLHSNVSSDDDEQNDYGFNKRPSVRGIKPKFSSTNEILQQMQAQLSQPIAPQNPGKIYSTSKQPSSTNNKVQRNIQHASVSQHQSERSWSFYADTEQRLSGEQMNQHPNYYPAIPTAIKQAFHGHEESLTYQNCHSVTMEQHYGRFARSPTRRPESPPPLRNYHQTMVLIPYNTESYAQFSSQDPKASQQFSRHNILEYQQVTQQTIRVPISYTLPGMQLHVVTGRGTQAQPQYLHHPRVVAPRPYNFQQDGNTMSYCERGVPEGAAASTHTDCKNLLSPTAAQVNQQNCTQVTNSQSSVPETVFYAMNV